MSSAFLDALAAEGLDPAHAPVPEAVQPVPGAAPTEEAQPGLLRRASRDVAVGLSMAPMEAARGAVGALEETANTATSIVDALPGGNTREQVEQDAANGGVQLPFGMGSIGGSRAARYLARPLDAVTDTLGAIHDFLPSSHTVTGGVVESVGQFITGNILAGRYLKFLRLSKVGGPVGQQVARDAIAGATAFDPYEERLTNLLRDHAELRDPVTAFLAADPNDNEAVARFKSAIENGGLGALGEGLFHAVRALRAARHGDFAGASAAAEEAERVVGEPEIQRLVSEELRLKTTHERWLKVAHQETEETAERATESTTTTATEGGPAGTEAPRPKIEGLPNTPGGEAIPQRVSLSQEDAARLASSIERAGGTPSQLDQEAVGVIWRNLDRMQSSEDGVALVRELEQLYEKNYLAARGAQADTEALALQANRWAQTAADIASTSTRERDMIVQAMVSDLQDARRIGARALAYSALTTALQRRLGEWAEHVIRAANGQSFSAFNGNREALYAAFLRDANFLANVDPLTLGLRSQFGRNLSILRGIVDGAADEGVEAAVRAGDAGSSATTRTTHRTSSTRTERHTIEDIVEGGEKFVVELAYRMRYANTAMQARRIAVKHFTGPGAWDAASEYWMGSLLSSPKTQAVNILVNTFRLGVQTPVERLMAGLGQGITGGGFHQAREALYQYQGMIQSLKDAVRLAGRSIREGDGILDPQNISPENVRRAITAGTFGQSANSLPGWIINSVGAFARAPSNLLLGQDEFFKQLAYRGRLYAIARREAADMGLDAAGTANHIAERLSAAFDTAGRATEQDALDYARQVTFTDEFSEGWLSRLAQGVQQLKARAPWMQVIVPFVRVPTNVLREVVNYNPVTAAFQREFRAELAAGGDRAAMAWARLGTGTAITALATYWALDGTITGAGPSNPQARAAWAQMGWQPNSIRYTDDEGNTRYVSYNRADPFGIVLSIAATIADVARETDNDSRDDRMDDLAMLLTAAVTKAMASKTYATGILQLAQAISDGDARLEKVMQAMAATLVPAVTRDLSAATFGNDYFREAHSLAEAMRARTPGFGDIDVRFNALGEPVMLPPGAGPSVIPQAILNVFSPASMVTSRADDPVSRELLRLQMQHATGFLPPSYNPGGIGVDLRDIALPGGGTAYGRLQMLVGEVTIGGKTIRERFADLFGSERYRRMTDGTGDIDGTKLQAVQAIFQSYHQAAISALRKEIPEVDQAIRARTELRREVMRGGAAVIQTRRQPQAPSLSDMLNDTP